MWHFFVIFVVQEDPLTPVDLFKNYDEAVCLPSAETSVEVLYDDEDNRLNSCDLSSKLFEPSW